MAVTAGQVTVDATVGGVALNTASSGQRLIVTNTNTTATNTAVLGPPGVAVGTGYVLNGGATLTVDLAPGEVLHAIRGTATSVVVHVLRSGA